jgi:hypothetical protein
LCPAQGVPEAGVGCDDWLGIFLFRREYPLKPIVFPILKPNAIRRVGEDSKLTHVFFVSVENA